MKKYEEMSLEELKASAYDILRNMEILQMQLKEITKFIQSKETSQ